MDHEARRRGLESILERRFKSAGGTDAEWRSEKENGVLQHLRDAVSGRCAPLIPDGNAARERFETMRVAYRVGRS